MTDHEYDIFLSYSSVDAKIAHLIYDHLTNLKYTVWLDKIEVLTGDDIVRQVFAGIKKSRFFAILLSQSSAQSKWVREELSVARIREIEEERVVILPLLYEDCTFPEALDSKRYADFRHSPPQGLHDLENALRTHAQRAGRGGAHPAPPHTAPEPTLEDSRAKLVRAVNGSEKLYMVMDLGGTKAYVSVMNKEGERFYDRKFGTENHDDPDKLFAFIESCIRAVSDGIEEICGMTPPEVFQRIAAIGIAFAGPTDFERGLILDAANFQIRDFPLAERLGRTFNVPVFVDNDVNLGVLGEYWKGVARGYRHVVGVIIGTGIGGGIIIDGNLYRGKNKTAGEIGHMVVDYDSPERCGCGQSGCFEVLASRKSIARDLHRKKAGRGLTGLIWEERNLGSNEIAHYFLNGDEDTVEVVRNASRICGKAVFSLLNLLNPEIILFGGGFVHQLGDVFLQSVREEAAKCMNAVYSAGGKEIPIVVGSLENPNLLGGCKMVVEATTQRREHPKSFILEATSSGLDENDLELLRTIYQAQAPLPISSNPRSDFSEIRLRPLRDRGLIQTVGGESFRKSRAVQITRLGVIVVEETF